MSGPIVTLAMLTFSQGSEVAQYTSTLIGFSFVVHWSVGYRHLILTTDQWTPHTSHGTLYTLICAVYAQLPLLHTASVPRSHYGVGLSWCLFKHSTNGKGSCCSVCKWLS